MARVKSINGPIKRTTARLPLALHKQIRRTAEDNGQTNEEFMQDAAVAHLKTVTGKPADIPAESDLPQRPFRDTEIQSRFDEVMLHGSSESVQIVEFAINAGFASLKAGRQKARNIATEFAANARAIEEHQQGGSGRSTGDGEVARPTGTGPLQVPRKGKANRPTAKPR